MTTNTFGALDFLIENQELTEVQTRLIYETRGKIAVGEFSRELWFRGEHGEILTFQELFDGNCRYGYDWGKPSVTPQIRQLLIGEYLLSDIKEMVDAADSTAGNAQRVIAELRRYGARMDGHTPRETSVTPEIVSAYCKAYNIEQLEESMLVATGLKRPEESSLGDVASQLAAHELRPDFLGMSGRVLGMSAQEHLRIGEYSRTH